MEHPFALKAHLSLKQASAVSGAGTNPTLTQPGPRFTAPETPEDLKKVIRPPMASTQAIGEEGGFIPD